MPLVQCEEKRYGMKYLYTPYDVAVFFLTADFKQSKERTVLRDLWENEKDSIAAFYREDEKLWRKHVYNELSKIDGSLCDADMDELDLLLQDTGHSWSMRDEADVSIEEQGVIESYFKIVRLNLTYVDGKNYHKIKLRRLLQQFGYQRRSAQLVQYMEETLRELSLTTYLGGKRFCRVSEVKIDDMVMIRLNLNSRKIQASFFNAS
jgi:hypothetical protein